ncbi:hypothetical protein Sjap_025917 [Stephania japonica]|uniref:Uncharacterized protein n=1 Tax=Stephania japonica TaxID=461633 RepID=A0AAP0E2N5_9MAGN
MNSISSFMITISSCSSHIFGNLFFDISKDNAITTSLPQQEPSTCSSSSSSSSSSSTLYFLIISSLPRFIKRVASMVVASLSSPSAMLAFAKSVHLETIGSTLKS